MQYLKSSLNALKDMGSKDRFALQEHMERDCLQSASEQLRESLRQFLEMSKAPNMGRVKRILSQWHPLLSEHFKQILEASTSFNTQPAVVMYAAMLSGLQVEKISIVAMQELTRIAALEVKLDGIPLARLATSIGACLEREVFAQQIFKKQFLAHTKLTAKQRAQLLHDRQYFGKVMSRTGRLLDENVEARQAGWVPAWTNAFKAEIGVWIVNEAIKLLEIEVDERPVPAFKHELVSFEKKRHGVIKLHKQLYEMLASEGLPSFIEPWALPMVVPPNPWISFNQGGYLTQKSICVRLKDDPVHLSILHEANANGKMDKLLHGLDVLGQTAWKINTSILKIAIEQWNSGINVATHQAPPLPQEYAYKDRTSFAEHKDYIRYVTDWSLHLQEKEKAHSTMCDTNYKLEIARQFAGIPFYLPHSVDFRGRAYPIPPHLSHVGSDLSRGLLLFAEGKPLGERGLFWLKVQLANMFGFDKYTMI